MSIADLAPARTIADLDRPELRELLLARLALRD
jgi:hypothetical protein